MIIQLIGDWFLTLINTLFTFTMPTISPSIINSFNSFVTLLQHGIDIYSFFVPPLASYIITFVISIKVFVDLYLLAMWIVKKIPMASIE